MAFQGGLALGSATWGAVAEHTSTKTSLICAAVGAGGESPVFASDPYLEGHAAGPDAVQVEAAVARVCGYA